MIRLYFFAALVLPILAVAQLGKLPFKSKDIKPKIAANSTLLKTRLDSLSYAIGLNVATNLREQGINAIENALVSKAFNDVYLNKIPILDKQTANKIVQQHFEEISLEKASAEKLKGLDFLNVNKKRAGVKSTLSGLQFEILKAGTGPIPFDTNTVRIISSGSLINGRKFDSTAANIKPVQVRISETIPGWAEALKLMSVGSKWKLYIPFYLAYGDNGFPPLIPPGATLIFEMELIEIVK